MFSIKHIFLNIKKLNIFKLQTPRIIEATIIESTTTLGSDTFRTDKNEKLTDESCTSEDLSPVTKSRPSTGDILKKNHESNAKSRPGTTSARPIPLVQVFEEDAIPKDPDKDWANVKVSGRL